MGTSTTESAPAPGFRFYLGTHQPHWLAEVKPDEPLFVSDRRLRHRKTLPRARGPWALDSGGFTELRDYGDWVTTTPEDYVARVRRYADEIANLQWAAPQDWMCEPLIIHGGRTRTQRFVGTRLSVAEHQRRTVLNYLRLRNLDADLPFRLVLTGFHVTDYLRCAEMYLKAGIDPATQPLVGIGSVCRRQADREAAEIFAAITDQFPGIAMHGFGVKSEGLSRYGPLLASADSMAWSDTARWEQIRMPGCTHETCQNCLTWARVWRRQLLTTAAQQTRTPRGIQMSLFTPHPESRPTR